MIFHCDRWRREPMMRRMMVLRRKRRRRARVEGLAVAGQEATVESPWPRVRALWARLVARVNTRVFRRPGGR